MKYLILVLTFASFAQASSTEYIYSYGRGTGFCDGGPQSWFCMDRVKDDAKRDGVREAYYTCSRKDGRLDDYSASCNYHCSPFSIPQDAPTQYVSCSSSCTTRCVILN